LGLQTRCTLEPVRDVAGRREQLPRLTERDAVEPLDRASRRSILGALAELAELCAVQLVRLAELVQEPDDLVLMPNGVRGELRCDHEVDRASVGLVEVEQPPEERLAEHPLA